jgi:hypothetical protein
MDETRTYKLKRANSDSAYCMYQIRPVKNTTRKPVKRNQVSMCLSVLALWNSTNRKWEIYEKLQLQDKAKKI